MKLVFTTVQLITVTFLHFFFFYGVLGFLEHEPNVMTILLHHALPSQYVPLINVLCLIIILVEEKCTGAPSVAGW